MLSKKQIFIVIMLMSLSMGCHTSREAYVSTHPELIPQIKQAILKGEVLEGMTQDEVKASWGSPTQIVKSTGGDFYYVYMKQGGKGTYTHDIVVFDKNGKMVSSGSR